MDRFLLLTAATSRDRNVVTGFVFDHINALGGWVDDVNMYSNVMTVIRFTIKEDRIGGLLDALAAEGVAVDPGKEDAAILAAVRDIERSCSLQISFIHNEPDLKREIPAIPGY